MTLLQLLLGSCSDMGDPEILLPQLIVDVESIEFSTITIGATQTKGFRLINNGEGELQVTLALVQDSSVYSLDPQGDFNLNPEDTLNLVVTFTPQSNATYPAEILVSSNDPENSDLAIQVRGRGTAVPVPVLSLSDNQLDFGQILSDGSVQKQITLSSTGNDTLSIDSVTVEQDVFQVDTVFPQHLIPGTSISVTVTFEPVIAGNYDGEMTIYSNSSSSPDVISLLADAEEAVSYATSVQPVWDGSCTGCHGTSAGLNLSSYAQLMSGANSGAVVIAGDGASSRLIMKLRGTAGSRMPLSAPPLADSTIDRIERWIDQGALDN